MPIQVVNCFAVLREMIIRHWPLDHVAFNNKMIGGKHNPFNLYDTLGVDVSAFKRVCLLISVEHQQVESLTPRQVYECDQVIEKLNLDKYRSRYYARSRHED